MIALSVDTTSQSYASGQVVGVLIVAVVAITLVWRLTRSWRDNPESVGAVGAAGLEGVRTKRRRFVIGVMVLIAAAATVKAVTSYHPEPRASQTAAPAAPTATAGGEPAVGKQPLTVTAPDSLSDYRLMTGEAADRADASVIGDRKAPPGKRWYYGKDGDENIHAVFFVNTVDLDPTLRAKKERDSITQEFRNFFAGAKARDVTSFDAGPAGGGLSCGHVDGFEGDAPVCAWSDASTFGILRLSDPVSLADAAKMTTTLRTTAVR